VYGCVGPTICIIPAVVCAHAARRLGACQLRVQLLTLACINRAAGPQGGNIWMLSTWCLVPGAPIQMLFEPPVHCTTVRVVQYDQGPC
jgi:hypothetical protein